MWTKISHSTLRRGGLKAAVLAAATIALLVALGAVSGPTFESARHRSTEVQPPANTGSFSVAKATASLFVENQGQVTSGVRYYSMGNPAVAFRDDGVMFVVRESSERSQRRPADLFDKASGASEIPDRVSAYLLRFVGSNDVGPEGWDKAPSASNFFIGGSENWRTDVPSFGRVLYRNLYDGIDLVYRASDKGVKYEFLMGPGARVEDIVMEYEGAELLLTQENGMAVRAGSAELIDSAPVSYAENGDTVDCGFEILGSSSFGFRCGGWDGTTKLVIDPLIYSTYLGASAGDVGLSVAVDSSGSAYVAGYTSSADFPATPGSYDTSHNGDYDAFVAKFNPAGSSLVYSTFIGGSEEDGARYLAIDDAGDAHVTGWTWSSDFPTTPGAFDTTFNGVRDAFIFKLNQNGNAIVYSTLIGGMEMDRGHYISLDPHGDAYITGDTDSPNFPATPGAFDTTYNAGSNDGFVAKLSGSGASLLYATYLGGYGEDEGHVVVADSAGYAYVSGHTGSGDFPTTAGAFDTVFEGSADAFLLKLDQSGGSLVYGTFIGGGGADDGYALAVNSGGEAYLAGSTEGRGFPTTPGAYDAVYNGGSWDAFVTRLNADGNALIYSTFIGSIDRDVAHDIKVNETGVAYITGETMGLDYPATADAFDSTFNGDTDPVVSAISRDGTALVYSTFLGGSDYEDGVSLDVDADGDVYAVGLTGSSDYPTTVNAFDRTFNGGYYDAYLSKLGKSAAPVILSFTATPAPEGSPVVFTVNATDAENDALTYAFDFDADGVFEISGPDNTASHVWGDDYAGKAIAQVSDGQLSAEANASVSVYNVPPSIDGNVTAFVLGNLTLRIAGEKWHDVVLKVYEKDIGIAAASIVRYPGSPDDQSVTIERVAVDVLGAHTSAVIEYTPMDDPVNGNKWGANPAWATFTAKDGSSRTLHHIFNVRHDDTWIWAISDLRALVGSTEVTFGATAADPGSDDLRFSWDWGDGTIPTVSTHYNDGVGSDPYPSPGGTFPFTASDSEVHEYAVAGNYTVVLIVEDDDGGVEEIPIVIALLP